MPSVAKLSGEDYGRCKNCGASGPIVWHVCGRCDALIRESCPPPEEQFAELFKAARMLLNEGIRDEDLIIPTLAFAARNTPSLGATSAVWRRFAKIGDTGQAEAWDREADAFVARHGSLRPLRLVAGVLLLERLPVSVDVRQCYPDPEHPRGVWIYAYLHKDVAKAKHVASLYERSLTAANIRHDADMGSLHFGFERGVLKIMVGRGFWLDPREGDREASRAFAFPRPHFIAALYQALMGDAVRGGFAKQLRVRKSGPAPSAAQRLILACVAHYLKSYRPMAKGRKNTLALLNDHILHVMGREPLPTGYSTSETNQLWRDVNNKKIGRQIEDTERALLGSQVPTGNALRTSSFNET